MSTAELKVTLIEKITNLNDDVLLQELMSLLNFQAESSVYSLSDEQKDAVAEARAEYKNGSWHTNDEANQEIQEWLKK